MMASITFPTIAPYGSVVVNTDTVFAAIAEPNNPERSSDLLLDSAGGRSIFVTASISDVGGMIGPDFVRFEAASIVPGPCYVNRRAWVSILPHPEVADVTQIHGHMRYVAVRGSVTEVRLALA